MKVSIRWTEPQLQGVLAALEAGAEPRLDPAIAARVLAMTPPGHDPGAAEPAGQLDLSLQEGQTLKAWCDARRERASTEDDLDLWTRIVARVNEGVQFMAPAKE